MGRATNLQSVPICEIFQPVKFNSEIYISLRPEQVLSEGVSHVAQLVTFIVTKIRITRCSEACVH